MTNMSIQPLWLTHFIEILLVLEFQLTKFIVATFSYKVHFRPQISSNMNRGRGSVVDSNFISLEYDGRADQAANETDSWERDHSYNTRDVTTYGKYLGELDTFGIDGI